MAYSLRYRRYDHQPLGATHKILYKSFQRSLVSTHGAKRPFHLCDDDKENNQLVAKRQRIRNSPSPDLPDSGIDDDSRIMWKEFHRHAGEMERRIVENLEETRAILREIVSFLQK